jgi:hypothetical protein
MIDGEEPTQTGLAPNTDNNGDTNNPFFNGNGNNNNANGQ